AAIERRSQPRDVVDADLYRLPETAALALRDLEPAHHGRGALLGSSVVVLVADVVVAAGMGIGGKYRRRIIGLLQLARPGEEASQKIGVQLGALDRALAGIESGQTALVLQDVREFMGAGRRDLDLGMLQRHLA